MTECKVPSVVANEYGYRFMSDGSVRLDDGQGDYVLMGFVSNVYDGCARMLAADAADEEIADLYEKAREEFGWDD